MERPVALLVAGLVAIATVLTLVWNAGTASAAADGVRFAVVGDYGFPGAAEADVAELIDSADPDFIVTTGDNLYGTITYDDAVGQYYSDYIGSYSGVHGPGSSTNRLFPAPGNHDYTDPAGGIADYLSFFALPGSGISGSGTSGTERYYDFIQGPVHFFVLDSHAIVGSGAEATSQQAWLQTQLAASTLPWQAVVLHHPPFSSGNTHGSNPAVQWPFASWGADVVFAGHEHIYERLVVDGIPHIISGLGGRSRFGVGAALPESVARYTADYGAVVVDACADGMAIEFFSLSGGPIDSVILGSDCRDSAPADEVVLVEANGRWHIPRPGQADYSFWYGMVGDVALLGDWDGDGLDTPGIYRPGTGRAYLSNTLPPDGGIGVAELIFFYGIAGDQVFVGDWDGDGTDTLGINRRGRIFLTNANATGPADQVFRFGLSTDIAFGGDADGDGTDTVFLYRPSNAAVFFTNSTPTGSDDVAPTDGSLFFGLPDDRFMLGDWDGDGIDTVGVLRAANRTVYLRNTNTTGPADTSFEADHSTWTPVAGHRS